MPTVQIILKERIKGLGAEADTIKVRAGYARNFLVPQGKALFATAKNLQQLEDLKAKRAQREAAELAEAEATAAKLKKVHLKLTLKTGAEGKAFGSISVSDILKALEDQGPKGISLEKHAIELEKAIKTTGKFDIPVRVHPDVSVNLRLTVSPEGQGDAEEAAAE